MADAPAYEISVVSKGPFAAYELSFAVPRGLSGSPLLVGQTRDLSTIAVIGVVIGNSKASMLVLEHEEHVMEPEQTTVVQQYESLTLGIAVQVQSILPQRSSLLGATVGEFLAREEILIERPQLAV